MNNVIDINKYRKPKKKDDPDSLEERVARIKLSIGRINELMRELRGQNEK